MLSKQVTRACMPTSMASTTIKAVILFVAGQAVATEVISGTVAALTEGALNAMLLNKPMKVTAVLLVAVAVVGSGSFLLRTMRAKPEQRTAQAATLLTKADKNKRGEKNPDKIQDPMKLQAKADKNQDPMKLRVKPDKNQDPLKLQAKADKNQDPLKLRAKDAKKLAKMLKPV